MLSQPELVIAESKLVYLSVVVNYIFTWTNYFQQQNILVINGSFEKPRLCRPISQEIRTKRELNNIALQ